MDSASPDPPFPLSIRPEKRSFKTMRGGIQLLSGSVLRAALCLFFLLRGNASAAWSVIPIDGHDYVSFSQVAAFYDFNEVVFTSQSVKLVKPDKILLGQLGAREIFVNNLRIYLSRKIIEHNGVLLLSRLDLAKVLDPVLRPARIQGPPVRTVILDPGHGGTDQGTWSYYGTEKAYTLDLVRRITPLLASAGLEVLSTRSEDRYVSLEDRVRLANTRSDALFISLHFNAGASTGGLETYALTPLGVPSSDELPVLTDFRPSPGNSRDSENIALATSIHGSIMRRLHLRDRGIRRARFHVLREIEMPGVLVEGGYLGGEDAFAIAHAAYRQNLAQAIADGILRYMAAVPAVAAPGRPVFAANATAKNSGPSAPPLPKASALVQSAAVADAPLPP